MKNLYIILTADIHIIGGMQLYTAGKANYLKNNNWDVKVLYDGNPNDDYKIKSLQEYNDGSFPSLTSDPFSLSKIIRKNVISKMIDYIGKKEDYGEILIESQSDFTAIWGELLAKEYNCKHICFNCNEQFRGKAKIYEKYIEFFKYKFDKKEMYGLHLDTFKRLFEGYYEVEVDNSYVFDALEPSPVQDVNSNIVNNIKKEDYNIAYIGRATKGYVPNIINAVSEFSYKHLDKKIQFIIVGETKEIDCLLKEKLSSCTNVSLFLLGDMVPIPRGLFSKIDVVIGGAVCAELSAREGIPTIVVDCENYLSNGVLGYTTDNSMYPSKDNKQEEIVYTLEDVLITKHYLTNMYKFHDEPNPNDIYGSQLELYTKIYINRNGYVFRSDEKTKINNVLKANAKALFPNLYYWYLKRIN